MAIVEIIFWSSLIAAGYSYFIYPVLLLIMSRRDLAPAPRTPGEQAGRSISIIIPARNEATRLPAKLANTLALQPLPPGTEIIVVSDASDDATDDIVRSHAARGVTLLRNDTRVGKERGQQRAIAASRGDLIVFTDVSTLLPEDSLARVLEALADPAIGAVSSVDRVLTPDGSVEGEGAYMKYEMWLRDLETRCGSVIGLSGSFFAAKREVCRDFDVRVPSDFGTALNCVRAGYRAVSDRRLIGIYSTISDRSQEYRRKLRTIVRGMNGLKHRLEVLNPFRFGRFAFQVFSHKLMRWGVPWFLIVAFLSNAWLALHSPFYLVTFVGQALAYLLPLLARWQPGILGIGPVRIWVFFVEANAAIVHATILSLRGSDMLTWNPSHR